MVRDLGPFISTYILLSNLLKRSEDANMNSVNCSQTVRGSGRNVTVFMLRNRSASRQKATKPEAVYDRIPKISASKELLELHPQCTPWQRHPPQLRPELPIRLLVETAYSPWDLALRNLLPRPSRQMALAARVSYPDDKFWKTTSTRPYC